jgi:DNA-binding Xre family transcriptional regulator
LTNEKAQLTMIVSQKDKEIKDLRQKLHISNKRIAKLELEPKDIDRSNSMISGN